MPLPAESTDVEVQPCHLSKAYPVEAMAVRVTGPESEALMHVPEPFWQLMPGPVTLPEYDMNRTRTV